MYSGYFASQTIREKVVSIFKNKKIQNFKKLAYTHRLLLASFIFFFLFSAVVKIVSATPLYHAGDTLDPTCAPGATDCTVQILPAFTSGSVLFADSTTVTEDNSNFFYDSSTHRLGLGTGAPSAKIHIIGTTEQSRLGYDSSNYLSTTVSSIGGVSYVITSSSGLPVFTFNKDLSVNSINIGKGKNSLSANTVVGSSAGVSFTTGNFNTMFGSGAGTATDAGSSNVFIGDSTGSYNTDGTGNTFIGSGAGVLGTSSGYSTIIGLNAGYKANSSYNVIIGFQAGAELTTGASANTYIGTRAGQSNLGQYNTTLGYYSGYDLLSGEANTVLGYSTGLGITTGDKNTIIGANVTGLSSSLSNNIILADGDGNQRININSGGNVGVNQTNPVNARLESVATTIDPAILGTGLPGTASAIGVKGTAYQYGVYGSGDIGVYGTGNTGVYGLSGAATKIGVEGVGQNRGSEIGVYGLNGKFSGLFENASAYESGGAALKAYVSYGSYTGPAFIAQNDGTGDLMRLYQSTNQYFTVNNSGNLGLGVSAPTDYKLQIRHDANTGTGIKIQNDTAGTAAWAGVELLPSSGAPYYILATSQSHSSYPNEFILHNSYNGKVRFLGASASNVALFSGSGAFTYYYDNSNYASTTVASDGSTTFALTGTTPTFNFSNNVGISCADADHLLEVGGTGTGCNTGAGSYLNAAGDTAFTANSSRVWKENISTIEKENILDLIASTPVRKYDWKPEYCDGSNCLNKIGFIAEEFYPVLEHGDDKHVNGQDVAMAEWLGLQKLIELTSEMDLKIEGLASLDVSNPNSLGSLIKTFLADAGNTIEYLYAAVIHSNRIETKELCVGNTCVTESQFLEIINGAGVTTTPESVHTPDSSSVPEEGPVPDENVEIEPENIPESFPDQLPQEDSILEGE
jgi:hypothetical protein